MYNFQPATPPNKTQSMETQKFTIAKQLYDDLSEDEQVRLRDYVVQDQLKVEKILPEKQVCCCGHCRSEKFVKNGTKDGKQRYLCRECGRTFSAQTGTLLARTRKDSSVWSQYVDCFLFKFPLQTCADLCGISLLTAFLWRHKILDALRHKFADEKLSGIVESDETFFNISFKGNHKKYPLDRPPKKRGGAACFRGISKEKVCVSCSVSLGNQSFARASNLGRASTKNLRAVLKDKIAPESTLVTDSNSSYNKLAEEMNLLHIKIDSGRHINGIYNIQKVNNYHSSLEDLIISTFHSVSTRYLNNYLIYQHILNVIKDPNENKKIMILTAMRDIFFTLFSRNVSARPYFSF